MVFPASLATQLLIRSSQAGPSTKTACTRSRPAQMVRVGVGENQQADFLRPAAGGNQIIDNPGRRPGHPAVHRDDSPFALAQEEIAEPLRLDLRAGRNLKRDAQEMHVFTDLHGRPRGGYLKVKRQGWPNLFAAPFWPQSGSGKNTVFWKRCKVSVFSGRKATRPAPPSPKPRQLKAAPENCINMDLRKKSDRLW